MDELDHGGKLRGRWVLFAIAAAFLALLGATVLLSVLFVGHVGEPQEGPHDLAPPPASGDLPVHAGELRIRVNGSAPAVWPPVEARLSGGFFRLTWANATANLTLRFRGDSSTPVRLAYDANLSRTNTFNATYSPIPAAPGAGSYMDFLSQEAIDRRVGGRLHLVLAGTVVETYFPHEEDTPNYRGMLSFAFFGGAAVVAAIGWWRKRRERGAR